MNNQIMVVNGNELTVKEYNGQRVVTLWDIAKLHSKEYKRVRESFDRNMEKHFVDGEDYFMVSKQDKFVVAVSDNNGFDKRVLNPIKEIPVLTESGYLLLVKLFTDDLSWAVQKQLIKSYFTVREIKEVIKKVVISPELAADQARFITDLAKAAGVSVESQILCVKELYRHAGMELPIEVSLEQKLYDLETIAKRLGIMSENGFPHANAVSAIIKQIDIPPTIKLDVLETNGKWTGSVTKYKEDIFGYLHKWLRENGNPTVIESNKRKFKVYYSKAI